MNTNFKSLTSRILIALLIGFVFFAVYSLGLTKGIRVASEEYKNQIDTMNRQIDSLRDEDFNHSSELGRYELTLEHLKEVNPKAGKDFEDYLNHETE